MQNPFKENATRYLEVDLMPTGIGTKYNLESAMYCRGRLQGLVQAKYINSERPPDAVRMVYKNFVRSVYEYVLALTLLSTKITGEVTKLENAFLQAILRMPFCHHATSAARTAVTL